MKTIKHPLFRREISQIRWSSLLLTVAVLLPILLILNEANDRYSYSYHLTSMDFLTDFPADILGWFTLPVLIISQFYYMRKDNVYGFMIAMPFTRAEHMKYKYFAGMSGIAFAYAVNLLVLSAAYFSPAHPITGAFAPLVHWFVLALLSTLFQYSFLFLTATIMGNSIFAGVGGFIIFYAPFFIVISTLFNISQFGGFYYDADYLIRYLLPHYISYSSAWYDLKSVPFSEYMLLLLVYAMLCFALYRASEKIFDMNDFEYNGNMCMFVLTEKIFISGFTLCFGLLALDIAQFFENGWLYPLAVVSAVGCFPVGYILAKRLLNLTGHQIQFKRG